MHVLLIIFLITAAITTTRAIEEDCTDFQGQNIKHGVFYVPGPAVCTMCVCYHSEPMWCKAIYCDPPYFCKEFRVGERCCEFECLDPPGDAASKLLEEYRKNRNKSMSSASNLQTSQLIFLIVSSLWIHIYFNNTFILPGVMYCT